jgi:hypothetical protein
VLSVAGPPAPYRPPSARDEPSDVQRIALRIGNPHDGQQEPSPSMEIRHIRAFVAVAERVRRAAKLPRGQRINFVRPPWLSETLRALGRDPSTGLPAADVARAYVASVEGTQTGTVLDPRA